MEESCVWFVVWTKNQFVEDWYEIAIFRSFAACRRYSEFLRDKFPMMHIEFKFEKVIYFSGLIVKRDFIA